MSSPSRPGSGGVAARAPHAPGHDWTLVWIDAHEAMIVGWNGKSAEIKRLTSDVPDHHRATGKVRHSAGSHPGGGPPGSAGEDRRQEHIRHFMEEVQRATPTDNDVSVRGPGTLAQHLATALRQADAHAGRKRTVDVQRSGPLTTGQLVAEVRTLDGDRPRRRTVGSRRQPIVKRKADASSRKVPLDVSEEL